MNCHIYSASNPVDSANFISEGLTLLKKKFLSHRGHSTLGFQMRLVKVKLLHNNSPYNCRVASDWEKTVGIHKVAVIFI